MKTKCLGLTKAELWVLLDALQGNNTYEQQTDPEHYEIRNKLIRSLLTHVFDPKLTGKMPDELPSLRV